VTEAEWQVCADAAAMLSFLRGKAGERQMRLLACACARLHWSGLVENDFRTAVEVAERRADGLADLTALRAASFAIWELGWGNVLGEEHANAAAAATVEDFSAHAAEQALAQVPDHAPALIREIFGNPFRARPFDLESSKADAERVRGVARAIYEDRRLEELPTLADFLTRAGCRDRELLAHLRSPGPHFRGCWALDAVIGTGAGKPLVTEAGWLGSTQPFRMLTWWQYLRGELSPRKGRLLACACCRLRWPVFADDCLRRAVETAEAFADGMASSADLARAHEPAQVLAASRGKLLSPTGKNSPQWAALAEAWRAAVVGASVTKPEDFLPDHAINFAAQDGGHGWDTVDAGQTGLIRDVLGNPFRQPALDPAWLQWNGGTIPRLAQAIYAERAFAHMPVLADALEDAGCTDSHVLNHCRQETLHVPGCWLIDLILAR
jgi:hypothetical protein